MKAYLKKFGVWEIVINPSAPLNKKGKWTTQKEATKDNTIALKFLMDGLSRLVKESAGEYTSTKYLWFNLESEYQKERPELERIDKESEDKPTEEVNQEEDKQEEDSSKGMDTLIVMIACVMKLRRFLQKMMKGYQRLHIRYISRC